MKNIFVTLVASAAIFTTSAVDFDRFFADSTLRLDYSFAGDTSRQAIYLDGLRLEPAGWFGRRHNLDSIPLRGNGQITMTDVSTGKVIYRHSFSTLFNEWLATAEAVNTPRAWENVYQVPFPLHETSVDVRLYDNEGKPMAQCQHIVKPHDILIARPSASQPVTPYRYIHRGGDTRDAIDVVILAEGYTSAEVDSFYRHAEATVESIFNHEPFNTMRDRFNFIAVAAESAESGVTIPRLNQWKNTAVGSNFSTFYSDRYLTTRNLRRTHDLLSGIPCEHLIILANTDEYGGGGIFNSYTLTTARHQLFRPVVVHEFGHSFGGLGDEYFYDNDVMSGSYATTVEPWEPNVAALVDGRVKWQSLLAPGTPVPTPVAEATQYPVGVYEGAAYTSKGLYRPADHCRMRDNETEGFCPVCQRAIENIIRFYTE